MTQKKYQSNMFSCLIVFNWCQIFNISNESVLYFVCNTEHSFLETIKQWMDQVNDDTLMLWHFIKHAATNNE